MLINIGVVFRKLRISKGYRSAEMFSYEHDLNRTAYWRWENGQNITMKNFIKICDIHEIPPRMIFEMIENSSIKKQAMKIAAEPMGSGYLKDSELNEQS